MRQSTKRMISLLAAVILLFASFFIFFNLIKPTYAEVSRARGEALGRSDFIATKRVIVDQVKNAIQQYEGTGELQQNVSFALPLGTDQADLFHEITSLAAADHLSVQSITAAAPVAAISKESISEKKAKQALDIKPANSIAVQLKLTGTYEDFKNFMGKLETNIRLMDVLNATVEPLGKANQDFYLFSVTVATYYQTQ